MSPPNSDSRTSRESRSITSLTETLISTRSWATELQTDSSCFDWTVITLILKTQWRQISTSRSSARRSRLSSVKFTSCVWNWPCRTWSKSSKRRSTLSASWSGTAMSPAQLLSILPSQTNTTSSSWVSTIEVVIQSENRTGCLSRLRSRTSWRRWRRVDWRIVCRLLTSVTPDLTKQRSRDCSTSTAWALFQLSRLDQNRWNNSW